MGSDAKPPITLPPVDVHPPFDQDDGPLWMQWMVRAIGTKEMPGTPNNPAILGAAKFIGEKFPSQQAYCATYNADSIPWCGLAVAWAMARASIMPPDNKFLSSEAWRRFGYELEAPDYGCVVCFEGHVALFSRKQGSTIYVIGGNQSDMVNECPFDEGKVIMYRWPASEDYRTGYYPDDNRE